MKRSITGGQIKLPEEAMFKLIRLEQESQPSASIKQRGERGQSPPGGHKLHEPEERKTAAVARVGEHRGAVGGKAGRTGHIESLRPR